MVRALSVHCKGTGSVPDQGTNIPQATWYGFKKKKSQSNGNQTFWDQCLQKGQKGEAEGGSAWLGPG